MGAIGTAASLYWFDERDQGANAYAEQGGNVVLGVKLLRECQARDRDLFMLSMGYIMAHEYGHQFQFKLAGTDFRPGTVAELQADILALAGYWAAQRLVDQGFGGHRVPRDVILRKAYSIGDYAFGNPQHHGTPDQRHHATQVGFDAGEAKQFGNLDTSYGTNARELYQWNLRKARAINGIRP